MVATQLVDNLCVRDFIADTFHDRDGLGREAVVVGP